MKRSAFLFALSEKRSAQRAIHSKGLQKGPGAERKLCGRSELGLFT